MSDRSTPNDSGGRRQAPPAPPAKHREPAEPQGRLRPSRAQAMLDRLRRGAGRQER